LTSKIISKIIDSLRENTHSDKHQNFLLSEFLKLLSAIDNKLPDKIIIEDFLLIVLKDTNSSKIKREIKKLTTSPRI
jgi:predicted MPP superfamily phosphohydrolase